MCCELCGDAGDVVQHRERVAGTLIPHQLCRARRACWNRWLMSRGYQPLPASEIMSEPRLPGDPSEPRDPSKPRPRTAVVSMEAICA